MYKPRHTSEFPEDAREDASVRKKRQTRTQLRTTTTPMKKSGLWQPQSRLNSISPSCNTKRSTTGGTVSNATPLRRQTAMDKDKKWVQEQAQLIAEYLDELMHCYPLQGFAQDFFSRGAASLRQMTMKQFVAIVNFFLQFVFGNRFNIGSNHVEEITSALHKLKYTNQVSKSWLMTPTTQHSFGHVIVMLDFLKDLAPPPPSRRQELGEYEEFPFMETSEHPSYMQQTLADPTATSNNLQISQIVLTEETNHLLFPSAAESFGVWDTQNWNEYAVLKRNVSERIIKCISDLPDSQSLDLDLVRLKDEIMHIEEQLQLTSDNKGEQLQQRKYQEEQLKHELLTIQSKIKEYTERIEQLRALSTENANRMKIQRKEIQKLQKEVNRQRYTAEQFQRMKVLLNDMGNEEQFYKRQMVDFTERGNNQQVRLSRAKKQLLDNVEKFNSHAQNIGLDSDICSASEKEQMELVLPLPPQYTDIQARSRRLIKLVALLAQRRAEHEERYKQLEHLNAELTLSNDKLVGDLNKINKQIELCVHQIERLPHSYETKNAMMSQHHQQLLERSFELSTVLERHNQEHEELDQLLQKRRQENCDFLDAAEQRQKVRLSAQDAFVADYKEVLAQAEEKLKGVEANIRENSIKLANFKITLNDLKLPSFKEAFKGHKQ